MTEIPTSSLRSERTSKNGTLEQKQREKQMGSLQRWNKIYVSLSFSNSNCYGQHRCAQSL